jgi:alpha-galactosidase
LARADQLHINISRTSIIIIVITIIMLSNSLLIILVGVAAAQNVLQDRALSGCWPLAANSSGGALTVIKSATTPNGFSKAPRGWNSWGVQGTPLTTPSYAASGAPYVNQTFVQSQCSVLADADILAAGYDLCSIDGGWYSSVTDDNGRVVANSTLFDMAAMGTYLHAKGLKLGVYSLPGIPCDAANKTIYGTSIKISAAFSGVEDTNGLCYFNYSSPNAQLYHNSLINLWASWGVDMIKLDYITPGSSVGSIGMPANLSDSVIAFHRAIVNNGRQIRLDISSNICRNSPYLGIWQTNADSMRVAVDIDTYGGHVFVGIWKIQGTIEQYRQFINLQVAADKPVTIHPDLDNLFIGNPAAVTGVSDAWRTTLMSHWIGASANLILGSDMTNLDTLGRQLITSTHSVGAADFCSNYPMQPRNPGTGSNQAMQLQAWVAGPDAAGQAYVLLTNLGTNQGRGGYDSVASGTQTVSATLADLGLPGSRYTARDVWSGNATYVKAAGLSAVLDEGQSRFWQLTLTG